MNDTADVDLTVRAAEKRDAGRGIARLSESTRTRLGVLSGDTVRIEGDRATVAKVWPGGHDVPDGAVRIDADTRANAGVKVGETVRVSPVAVADATAVTFEAPGSLETVDVDRETIERSIARDLRDRPLTAGESVHVERLGGLRFTVTSTDPDGTIRLTDRTDVSVVPAEGSGGSTTEGSGGSTAETDADTTPDSGEGSSGTSEPRTLDTGASDLGAPDTGASGPEPVRTEEPPRAGATYEDIGGLDEELDLVRELVELPLSSPELFTRLGVDPPKGVLLYGPPGTGKTLIARAVANEVDATFITVDGPEITSKYKGESEKRLREVFERAREDAPAIVFFDEIDSIAGERDDGGDLENRVVGQLLSLMDGLDARGDVIVIGATNRVDALDPALRRGGRFDREIEIGVPGEAGRRQILDVHTRRTPLAEDVDLGAIAARTHGFVGADLESLTQEAAMTALRRAREAGADLTEVTVTRGDFEDALTAVEPSAMREYVAETPETTFADVGGLEPAKRALEKAVTWPLSYGPLFEAAAADPPTGVLLHGPPGTGKTLLARAIAGESGVNFIQVAGPELLDRYVGESEKSVREVFERARQTAPTIVFFDEIDAIATARGGGGGGSGGGAAGGSGGGSAVGERVVSQLLTELDRAAENPSLVVIAATNRREALDPALLRPGRLETHVEVPNPDREARVAILEVHTTDQPLAEDVDLDAIAAETAGLSGAELAAICREAALAAIEDVTETYGESAVDHSDAVRITADHYRMAVASVVDSRS
ncbi:transitional endoplasmic reticulum ATPase [Halopenitus malekzadehii]|uniref:Transitional endoplasmic reticulum ATPase n=1 Tax=Halopenitus malekzadehii TaxID=1267564 RepID=A0A1H6I3J8_9EURY|nr:AAA family ATPase [Halopenitus malekzadehii]SEH41247.1 transitional endoplasmic reticulum ATPase [Halopenitus malekzadehii]